MILRKPYAFFIKHFKLIHIILAVLVAYNLIGNYKLLNFFNEYIVRTVNVIGQDLTGTLLTGLTAVIPIIVILLTLVVMVVMIVKEKPILFYVINIVIFIYLTVVLQVTESTLTNMESVLLNMKTIRLVRDLLMVGVIVEAVSFVILLVRGTGFNIKKFDFDTDLAELEIEETDNEEFEVNIDIDKNKARRNVRYLIRKLKYTYKENKLKLIGFIVFVVLVLVGITLGIIYSRPKIYKQGEIFRGNGISLAITDSYLTKYNYLGNEIEEDSSFLILRLKVRNVTKGTKLDFATTKIVIGNYSYFPTLNYRETLFDFGNMYSGEDLEVNEEYVYETLVYKIPTLLVKDDIKFHFISKTDRELFFKSTEVDINYRDLDYEKEEKKYTLKEQINLENMLSNYSLSIDTFDINKYFKIKYNYCYKDECYESYEYLYPNVVSNYDKVLIKLTGKLNMDENVKLTNVFDLYDFIYYFGSLEYEIDGKIKKQPIKFKEVVSKRVKQKDTYYLEVLEEVKDATKINLVLKVRGQEYKYSLK